MEEQSEAVSRKKNPNHQYQILTQNPEDFNLEIGASLLTVNHMKRVMYEACLSVMLDAYLLKQWAAVRSHLQCMSVAPQRCKRWNCRLATHGHSPRRAPTPPTILWWLNSGRLPQSGKRNPWGMQCSFSWILTCLEQLICFGEKCVLLTCYFFFFFIEAYKKCISCHNIKKLTTVFLIGFIRAVSYSVTLRVDLADAHSCATVKVSAAVYSS